MNAPVIGQRDGAPQYKSHKVVRALKIKMVEYNGDNSGQSLIVPDHPDFSAFRVDNSLFARYMPAPGDYFVMYPDGYHSISPKAAFEDGYTEVKGETFEQLKITGYRQLSYAEVDLMNEAKALAEQCGAFVAKLRTYPSAMPGVPPEAVEVNGVSPLDQRWISIGATSLQQGFMAIIRGIAQPTTF